MEILRGVRWIKSESHNDLKYEARGGKYSKA